MAGVRRTGALQLPGPNAGAERLAELAKALPDDWLSPVAPSDAAELAGLGAAPAGLHFPHGAAVVGPRLAAALLAHPGIEFQAAAVPAPAAPAGAVQVLATGAAVVRAVPELEVMGLAGQADRFAGTLRMPVLADGYFAPAAGGCWTGSTYEHRPWAPGAATAANAARFEALFGHRPAASLAAFRGVRAVTSDRAPVIGRVDGDTYVSAGHGSQGLAGAALAGEWIASLVCGEAPPVTRQIEALCRVGRFRDRQRRRPNPWQAAGRSRRTRGHR